MPKSLNASRPSAKTTLITAICVVAIVGLIVGAAIWGSDYYYLISVGVIVLTMIPFFASFEQRAPQARELMVLAVLIALAVASRAAFFWLPHFKPMCAIVMIIGIAFGCRAGFMSGAMAVFVSNFLFGQGPWTPWQMLAFALAGFVAGLLADKGLIHRADITRKQLLGLSIGAGLFVLVIVGPILDTASLFMLTTGFNAETAVAVYGSGLPVNAIHGLATALTLFLLYRPLLEKLDRVRVKYGLMGQDCAL